MVSSNTESRRVTDGRADVTWESYRIVVDRAFAARESNSRLTRDFFERTTEEIQVQTNLNRCVAEKLAEHTHDQGEAPGLAEDFTGLYEEFPDSPPGIMGR